MSNSITGKETGNKRHPAIMASGNVKIKNKIVKFDCGFKHK